MPPASPASEEKKDGHDSDDDPSLIKPILNGARFDKYYWTQTLGDVTLSVYVPDNTRAKDVNCEFTQSKV